MSATIIRALLVFCILFTTIAAFSRMELEDQMQMSRFHEPVKGGSAVNPDDAYVRYLSEYFARPVQRRSVGLYN